MIERSRSRVDFARRYWGYPACLGLVYAAGLSITHDFVSAWLMSGAIAFTCTLVALPWIAWGRVADLQDRLDDLLVKYQRLCDYTDNRVEEVEARTGAIERRVGMNRFNLPKPRKEAG